ncbi:MAG: dehydrogenase [Acidobacteria bacterium RIFCSPLOWO2_02_FULL_68_18]|nr:MAG: dehydrogenase [Acidobacteria bacterium RIFCSPLOWO2_02_FULL_68_18]OFW48712.1 MAG: dehydrogenase [Acidobacteria bacterium RIFCSPLOWO2_12_FULL_68_19]
MARVNNWQIGRAMDYWYSDNRPTRQFGAVFDINKCIACQTCTLACKTTWTSGRGQEFMFWNNVETKPYGYYPLAWDVELLDALGPQTWDGTKYTGRTVFEAAPQGERVLGWTPQAIDYASPNIGEDEITGSVDQGLALGLPQQIWMFYLARICNHCTYPACLASCPRSSIYKRQEDGIVVLDQSRCRGYQECVRACPYKKVYFNPSTGTSEKCIACFPKIEEGIQPQCFVNCIGKIRLQGWVNPPERAREDNPIDYLVHVRKLALPLYPQFGLEPNVYYVPPVNVPDPFLVQTFGPGAPAAVKTYRNARNDKTLAGLFALFGSTERTIPFFRISGDEAIALDDDHREIMRVPIYEPVYIRPAEDPTRRIIRMNTT